MRFLLVFLCPLVVVYNTFSWSLSSFYLISVSFYLLNVSFYLFTVSFYLISLPFCVFLRSFFAILCLSTIFLCHSVSFYLMSVSSCFIVVRGKTRRFLGRKQRTLLGKNFDKRWWGEGNKLQIVSENLEKVPIIVGGRKVPENQVEWVHLSEQNFSRKWLQLNERVEVTDLFLTSFITLLKIYRSKLISLQKIWNNWNMKL